jgi:predicted enzyme related to lactoylglutathione lyase
VSEPIQHFLHVEIVHPDPDAAARFTQEVLGAEVVEPRTAALIETFMPGMRCVHMRVGNIVFQFIKPGEGMDSWREQLEREGPSVHNIAYTVGDIEAVRRALVGRGAKILKEFTEVDMTPAGLVGELFTTLMIDAREQIGLRLELLEASCNWPRDGNAP